MGLGLGLDLGLGLGLGLGSEAYEKARQGRQLTYLASDCKWRRAVNLPQEKKKKGGKMGDKRIEK